MILFFGFSAYAAADTPGAASLRIGGSFGYPGVTEIAGIRETAVRDSRFPDAAGELQRLRGVVDGIFEARQGMDQERPRAASLVA